jgi:hypothetical protein
MANRPGSFLGIATVTTLCLLDAATAFFIAFRVLFKLPTLSLTFAALGSLLGDFLVVFVGDFTIMCLAGLLTDFLLLLVSVFLRGAAELSRSNLKAAEVAALITIREYKKFVCPRT